MTSQIIKPFWASIFTCKPIYTVFVFICILNSQVAYAQTTKKQNSGSEIIEVLSPTGIIIFKTIDDSTKLTLLSQKVTLKQGGTYFYCDSCVLNNRTNELNAWGNVHINQSDTSHIYAGTLHYDGRTKLANFITDVKLTTKEIILTTPSLDYNTETNIGIYKSGGKVINKKSVITSREGWYYGEMHDMYFKGDVKFNDPALQFETDSVLYNTETQKTKFIAFTTIKDSSGRTIKTKDGYYNQTTKKAEFYQRPELYDEDNYLTANQVAMDDTIYQAKGNAIFIDKKNKTTLIAGEIYQNKGTSLTLATILPLMILQQDNDSLFIKADILRTGKLTSRFKKAATDSLQVPDSTNNAALVDSSQNNASKLLKDISTNTADMAKLPMATGKINKPLLPDSLFIKPINDSIIKAPNKNNGLTDKINLEKTKDTSLLVDSLKIPEADSLAKPASTEKVFRLQMPLHEKDSTNRYFEAIGGVKIFHDSVQCSSDSLFYSFVDSTFRLYKNPVVWSKNNQITGDTIYLYTKLQKADKVEAFNHSFLLNHIEKESYNQVKSKRIDAWFKAGEIDSVRAFGNAECIYFLLDADSAYVGINECTCDLIDFYFANKEITKVAFRTEVDGTIWPLSQRSPSEMRLKEFEWIIDRRPKSKLEMYE